MNRVLIAVAAAALLAGCAARAPFEAEPATDGLSLEQRQAALAALPGWEMRGRLAIDTGERAYQARFEWRQEADRLRLSIRGPLGAGGVEVSGSDQSLMVRARGESYALDDPEIQLSEVLGWWLPVASLDNWLLGLPDRLFEADAKVEAGGRLLSLEQRLWRLDYDRFELAEQWLLPRRIAMNHEDLHIRLTVDAWRPTESAGGRLN